MLAVADINAIWRIKPFVALSRFLPVAGLSPRRCFAPDPDCLTMSSPGMSILRIGLPPGWASRLAPLVAGSLLRRIRSVGASGLFVTSPHYLSLARLAAKEMPVYYYCSDDYSTYAGWGGEAVEAAETELMTHCRRSFFVSRFLAEKAVHILGTDPSHVEVSPNATEDEFFQNRQISVDSEMAAILGGCRPPVLGVIGAINERLDFELLLACANQPEVGTLLLVGPVAFGIRSTSWKAVASHPKVILSGARPHREIPAWMRAIDVALIPYAKSPLNRACSPMRLFDHLASGKPIVATSACAQIEEFDEHLSRGGNHSEVLELVRQQCLAPSVRQEEESFLSSLTWRSRAQFIFDRL